MARCAVTLLLPGALSQYFTGPIVAVSRCLPPSRGAVASKRTLRGSPGYRSSAFLPFSANEEAWHLMIVPGSLSCAAIVVTVQTSLSVSGTTKFASGGGSVTFRWVRASPSSTDCCAKPSLDITASNTRRLPDRASKYWWLPYSTGASLPARRNVTEKSVALCCVGDR